MITQWLETEGLKAQSKQVKLAFLDQDRYSDHDESLSNFTKAVLNSDTSF